MESPRSCRERSPPSSRFPVGHRSGARSWMATIAAAPIDIDPVARSHAPTTVALPQPRQGDDEAQPLISPFPPPRSTDRTCHNTQLETEFCHLTRTYARTHVRTSPCRVRRVLDDDLLRGRARLVARVLQGVRRLRRLRRRRRRRHDPPDRRRDAPYEPGERDTIDGIRATDAYRSAGWVGRRVARGRPCSPCSGSPLLRSLPLSDSL